MNTLSVAIYEHEGSVVLHVETEEGEMMLPLSPPLADELADRLKASAMEARASNPEAVT